MIELLLLVLILLVLEASRRLLLVFLILIFLLFNDWHVLSIVRAGRVQCVAVMLGIPTVGPMKDELIFCWQHLHICVE